MENITCPLCGENMAINETVSHDKHIGIKDATKLKGTIDLYSCNNEKHTIPSLQYIDVNGVRFGPCVFISKGVIFINYDDGRKTFAFIYKVDESYFVHINDKNYGPWEVYPFLVYDNGFIIKTGSKNKFNNAYLDIKSHDYSPWKMIRMEFNERIKEAESASKERREINKYKEEINDAYKAYKKNTNNDSDFGYIVYCEFIELAEEIENAYREHKNIGRYRGELGNAYKKCLQEMKEYKETKEELMNEACHPQYSEEVDPDMEYILGEESEDGKRIIKEEKEYEEGYNAPLEILNEGDEENPHYEDNREWRSSVDELFYG